MSIDNCPRCGQLYARNAARLCVRCQQEDEETFLLIRKYLGEHPKSSVTEVAESLDVRESLIIKFIRMGRLETKSFPNLGLECTRCGDIISEGRYCDNCAKHLSEAFTQSAETEEQPDAKSRMHISRFTRKK